MKRIGLFGGSFDPVHLGHLLVAQAACEELALDRLFFIPAAQSPFKPASEPASAALRLRMLRLALVGRADYEIDEQEIQRGGTSFTIDTVRSYVRRFPRSEFSYLIGTDHVPTLPKWREVDELARLVQFVVIPRPGEVPAASPSPFRIQVLGGWPMKLSSSEIRTRVRSGLPVDHLVPFGVAEVIREAWLYQTLS
ncbi:MAG TPA: nicotinate-nucleotide adenylyltransferase [Candidatus Limnocylindria bacterium]|nr:nicotinate-nucleotide adenylyltransferase [Candidatus Limnocylindria bacterium]